MSLSVHSLVFGGSNLFDITLTVVADLYYPVGPLALHDTPHATTVNEHSQNMNIIPVVISCLCS